MISLYDSQISQILPEYLSRRASVQALSYALGRAVQRLIGYCSNIGVFVSLDAAPGDVVDMLAAELGTQYYDTSLDIAVRRKLVKNTMVWYMKAGTPQAVEELVAAVFGEGRVVEWFDYAEPPYTVNTFEIITNAQLTEEIIMYFMSIIKNVKNARSHIRRILINRPVNAVWYAAAGCTGSPQDVIGYVKGIRIAMEAAVWHTIYTKVTIRMAVPTIHASVEASVFHVSYAKAAIYTDTEKIQENLTE